MAGTEALALVSLAPLVQTAAEGNDRYQNDFGPVSLDLSLAQLAGFAAAMLIVSLIVGSVTSYIQARLTTGYQLRTRLEVVRAFQGADWNVQAQEREGWLRTLSGDNVGAATGGLQSLATWLKGVIGMSVFIVGAVAVSLVATLVITLVLGAVVILLRPLNSYIRRIGERAAELNLQTSQELATLTMTARELKLYGVVGVASGKYRTVASDQRALALRSSVLENLGAPLFKTVAGLLIVAMIAMAATRDGSDVASVGVVALFLYRSSNFATQLVYVQQRLAATVPMVEQLLDGVDRLWSNQIEPGNLSPERIATLEARDVSFRYPNQHSNALDHVSMTVGAGEVIGIVGPSGGGKSTLAELLVGLRSPTSGAVTVDGVDLRNVSDGDRSRCIALVSQAVPLIPASILENVRFFREISDFEVGAAVEAAGLAEAVAGLPDGLETAVGPGARALSGGQTQRIGIARALAGQPEIIVLDEPTSSLDALTEQVIVETIGRLRGTVGIVVIAHRLSTLRYCDRIVVVEDAHVTDQGTMPDVQASNSYMRRAYEVGRLD